MPSLLRVAPSGVHERGVYAAAFIAKGARIIEYTGRRVPESEVPEDEDNPHTFLFGLDDGIVIDPEVGGNEARWINHGCDPNCETIDEDGRIFIYALRDIEPGEELFYDYALQIDEPITKKSKKLYECLCGSPKCRGTMLALSSPSA
jgi:SET domain-containing protein